MTLKSIATTTINLGFVLGVCVLGTLLWLFERKAGPTQWEQPENDHLPDEPQ